MILAFSDSDAQRIRSHIDLAARSACIQEVVDVGHLERIVGHIRTKALPVELPEELYGYVDVRVVSEDGEVIQVSSDEFTMDIYGDAYYPVVLSAPLDIMSDSTLSSYSAFCGSFCAYIDSLVLTSSSQLEVLDLWISRLKARLLMLYEGSQTVKRELTKVDPAIVQLEDYRAEVDREKKSLESEMKHINARIRLVGQDFDRRRSSYIREARAGYTTYAPNPKPMGRKR